MISANEFLTRLQRKLNDEEGEVWTREFLLQKAQEGYDKLCRDSECLFDMEMFDNQPLGGNHTREFEAEYMEGPVLGRFNFTRESEREFMTEGAIGPVNHTRPNDASAMSDAVTAGDSEINPSVRTLARLSRRYVSVDRVTHDWLRLSPQSDRYFRDTRIDYETRQSGVWSYSMDQDGIFNLRTVGVPEMRIPAEVISGVLGGIREITSYSFDEETIIGTYGVIRQVPRHFVTGDGYGVIRRIVPDDVATRVELYRLGKPLAEHVFEIPDYAVRYVEWYAMHKAFSEPGEGENKELSDHFKDRFIYGVGIMKRRVNAVKRERAIAMGNKREHKRDSYLELFPATHGYKRPFNGSGGR